jgi:hypothetical protein
VNDNSGAYLPDVLNRSKIISNRYQVQTTLIVLTEALVLGTSCVQIQMTIEKLKTYLFHRQVPI